MDRRQQRTRTAIQDAFIKLVFNRRYDDFGVHDLVATAGIGRSTFYEHYKSKDDVLRALLDGMLGELAAAAAGSSDAAGLRGLLAHFWDNRRLGKTVFGPPMGMATRRRLAEHIEAVLGRGMRARAAFIASGQIGLLHAWLSGEISADIDEVAAALTASR